MLTLPEKVAVVVMLYDAPVIALKLAGGDGFDWVAAIVPPVETLPKVRETPGVGVALTFVPTETVVDPTGDTVMVNASSATEPVTLVAVIWMLL